MSKLEEIKNRAKGLTDEQGYFADIVQLDVDDYAHLYEQAKKAERYEEALKEIMKVNEKHEWNLYGLAYAIAEKALLD